MKTSQGYLYRILTEDKNREKLEKLVSKYFPGFSIAETVGYWQGAKEKSITIEIYIEALSHGIVRCLAEDIRILNNQEVVFVQWLNINGEFV